MVGAVGIEPTTPSMSPRCSPAELCALIVESGHDQRDELFSPDRRLWQEFRVV